MKIQLKFGNSPYPVNLNVSGLGLLMPDGDLLDAEKFRELRESAGVTITTDSPNEVCNALGVPLNEAGIIAVQ
ncbi:MAG: hypothetical protein OEV28_03275 [Nitrospirota bacterium]|nr:hypothetical protein [Nitrospirota bacterium]